MSKADKIFQKNGYVVKIKNPSGDEMYRREEKIIIFYKHNKSIVIYPLEINMQELKAINEKVKELGWLDE